MQSLSIAEPEL